jgi:hypothetical protein
MAGIPHHDLQALGVVQSSDRPRYVRKVLQPLHHSIVVSDFPICATNNSPDVRPWDRGVSAWWWYTLPDIRSLPRDGMWQATFPEFGNILQIQRLGIDPLDRRVNVRRIHHNALREDERHPRNKARMTPTTEAALLR